MLERRGFTLTELIVTVTILWIISTVAFISYSQYTQSSRDAVRAQDVGNMNTVLNLYKTYRGTYPEPSSGEDILYNGSVVWTQGEFGSDTQRQTGKIFGELVDPKYGNHYTYSVTQSRKEYQLGVVFEKESVSPDTQIFAWLSPIGSAYAAGGWGGGFDPRSMPNLAFWYDGLDTDADGLDDDNDADIGNIGFVPDVAPVAFTPFYFNRSIWLDGQDINGNQTSPNTGTEVQAWVNKTGAGYNGFMPTSGNGSWFDPSDAPTYETATAWNGNPKVVDFDGTDDRIVINRWDQPAGQAFSLAYMFSVTDTSTNHASIIAVGPEEGGNFYQRDGAWQLSRDGLNNYFIFRTNGRILNRNYEAVSCGTCGSSGNNAEVAFSTWTDINDGQPHMVYVQYKWNRVSWYLDGELKFTVTIDNSEPLLGEYFRFYGNRAGGAYLEWKLGEVFIVGDTLSAQQLEQIEGYLAHKWGWESNLPSGHPYESAAPLTDSRTLLEYTRYSGNIPSPYTYNDYLAFVAGDPTILTNANVFYPGSMPGVDIESNLKTHVWKGKLKVDATGNYTFSTNSDDYSFVIIDDTVVVNNGGAHGATLQSGSINLTANTTYDFTLIYGEITGDAQLDYRVDGPGTVWYRVIDRYWWNDKSGNGNHLTQSGTSLQPSYSFSKHGFDFEAGDYFDFTNTPYTGSQDLTFLAVWWVDDVVEGTNLWGHVFGNNGWIGEKLYFGASWMNVGETNNLGFNILWHGASLSSYDVYHGNNLQRYFANGQNYSQQTTASLTSYDSNFTLGGVNGEFNGTVYEIVGFSDNLSDADRQTVEGYLASKWGFAHKLPSNHPFFEALSDPSESNISVYGNYNGLFVHSNTGENHYIIATPSIIATTTRNGTGSWSDILDVNTVIGENRLVYNGYDNIPSTYSSAIGEVDKFTDTSGFTFFVDDPVIFDGTKNELVNFNGISQIDRKVRQYYTNSKIYGDLSEYLDSKDSGYVKSILSNSIGINPINPYYCKDILQDKFASNVAPQAQLIWSLGHEVWLGIESLTDGSTSTEGQLDYAYHTDSGDEPEVTLQWDDPIKAWFVRIYNRTQSNSNRLSFGTIELYDSTDTIIYTYVIGDTTDVPIIDVDFASFSDFNDVKKMKISTSNDFDTLNLREIEVYQFGKLSDGIFTVDDDGIGWKSAYSVYCDMTTDGGWWTRVGENFLDRGDFYNQVHPNKYTNTDPLDNTIRTNISSPVPNANVVQQTGAASTEYTLHIDEIPTVDFTTEIRISAWVADAWNNGAFIDGGYGYIFDNRLNYTDGSFSTNGKLRTLETVNVGGRIWKKQMVRIPIEKEASDFTWNVGKWAENSKDLFFTDLKIEIYYK